MNKYELALVINGRLSDEERDNALQAVKGIVERFNGKIGEVEDWGKKRLAYEIQKMHEGFYYFIHFEAESSAPAEIESRVRILEPVLRYLIVKEGE
ncbi:30S ribosomal protein S6 [Lachnospiraceae bacterium oral taxon 500]|nr:30S ribosomal protein S6 [Lachnospiraceae bacterium oral taxon 500]